MGWYEDLINFLRYGGLVPKDEDVRAGRPGLSENATLSGPPQPTTLDTEYRWPGEARLPWNKPETPLRDYSNGYTERFDNGGTFSIGKRNPDWAPDEEEDQLSSIMTTAALQQLVTNRRVDPDIARGVASLKEAAVRERERRDLAPGRDAAAQDILYNLDLKRQGKLTPEGTGDLAAVLVGASRTSDWGVDPTIAAAATDILKRSARTPGTDRPVAEPSTAGPAIKEPMWGLSTTGGENDRGWSAGGRMAIKIGDRWVWADTRSPVDEDIFDTPNGR